MFTFGGVFVKTKNLGKFFKNQILKSYFIQLDEHSFSIKAPVLTNKETDLMNQHLPSNRYNFIRAKKIKFIPEEMRSSYHSFYRHFPNYMEVKDF
jgi:hypothetical protein